MCLNPHQYDFFKRRTKNVLIKNKFLMYIILTLLLFNTLLLICIENILDRVEVDTGMDAVVMDAEDTA